jgi:hypothetical protein
MKYNTYTYSLKVWLTSVGLAPVLFLLVEHFFGNQVSVNEAPLELVYLIVFGFLSSIPSFFLFWLFSIVSVKIGENWLIQRLIISVVGVFFTFLPFYILDVLSLRTLPPFTFSNFSAIERSIPVEYPLTIIGAIWFYRLKRLPADS